MRAGRPTRGRRGTGAFCTWSSPQNGICPMVSPGTRLSAAMEHSSLRRPSPYPVERGFDVMMTPMIDMVFLLLVFFVCTAGFDRPEENLPSNLSLPGVG